MKADCRKLEKSRRVAPPKWPSDTKCWPNQAILSEYCSRFTILLDLEKVEDGTSVENTCEHMRIIFGAYLLQQKYFSNNVQIVLICDNLSNDSIEVTLSTSPNDEKVVKDAVKFLSLLLSQKLQNLKDSLLIHYVNEIKVLEYILEIKVETTISNDNNRLNYLFIILIFGILLLAFCSLIYVLLTWKQKSIFLQQSEISLSVTDNARTNNDEEKSNNLQNEENFRRYKKGSSNSLSLSIDPGPSGSQWEFDQNNSQTLFKAQNDKCSLKINNLENDNK
jgi:jagged-like protein